MNELEQLRDENQQLRSELEAANKWKEAVQEAAVLDWVLTTENENDPRKAVHALLCHAQQVALDPQVSEDARTLRDAYKPELERLRAIVAKLPKTADGVPITPGMLVYRAFAGKVEVRRAGDGLHCVPESSTVTVTDWCWYSTREAALAASKGEMHHG